MLICPGRRVKSYKSKDSSNELSLSKVQTSPKTSEGVKESDLPRDLLATKENAETCEQFRSRCGSVGRYALYGVCDCVSWGEQLSTGTVKIVNTPKKTGSILELDPRSRTGADRPERIHFADGEGKDIGLAIRFVSDAISTAEGDTSA
ncbi:hypothetical protein RRG08_051854 [Elysia crispata]|uniref:Uncharacterized protein n=1 Tax=Elysia crispata TaxID=231223 RepID=A0AAE0Z9K8_9GAST|nr:hypothetical protein RRG08_051854 [Elysia crispata]